MKIPLIWNKNNFKSNKVFDFELIFQPEKLDLNRLNNISPIFILAELQWHNYSYFNFYGFEIIRELRLIKKNIAPIVIFSFLPKQYFLSVGNKPIYNILKTPGHYFYQLPIEFNHNIAKSFDGLDENTLHDINTHFFFTEGVIDEEFHGLKNRLLTVPTSYFEKQIFFEDIKMEIESSFQRIDIGIAISENQVIFNLRDRMLAELEVNLLRTEGPAENRNLKLINTFSEEIKKLLPPNQNHPIDSMLAVKPIWKVLYVEDDKVIAKQLQDSFRRKNIDCLVANNAKETFAVLDADVNQDIAVLVCDYRLLNEDKSWQTIQGYNILEKVFFEYPNAIALFSLTSFNKRTLLRIQKLHKMQVWSYSKDDIVGQGDAQTGFNVFVEKIIEEGEHIFNYRRSQPRANSWSKGYESKFDKPLGLYYKLHRLSKDFKSINDIIEIKSTTIFKEILSAKNTLGELNFLDIPNIQENIGKDKKNPQTDEQKLERFRERLIGRRIAIALYHLLEMDKGQIFNTMKRNHFTLNRPLESDNTINQYFTTYMALSLEKDIPKNLLPEEKNWLENLI